MATLEVLRLAPRGAFHFGLPGVGYEATGEYCPSDTLYSALLSEALLGRLITPATAPPDVPFRLSSALPYAGTTLLFPVPRQPAEDALRSGMRKQFKKIRYVSQSIFTALLAGRRLLDYLSDERAEGLLYQEGSVLIHRAEQPKLDPHSANEATRLWQVERVDHVTVDRTRAASQYYAVGQVRFRAGCGLYVLAHCRDGRACDQLRAWLERLGHAGLGGRRSKGLGQFEVETGDRITLPDSQGARHALLLSRYIPTPTELEQGVLGAGAAYDLERVSGWLYSPGVPAQTRKTIYLLRTGDVVRCPAGRAPDGAVVDLRPDNAGIPHAVWRYGWALSVGIALAEEAA
ncbi:type III-A CRISPR-associated RAMP protein Csm4 [Kallotenue papyrolyticum]|uniref:type III-A CRISPR-associated RAMP protein Csm4 n=1 Tax=Kallotenue papyrolyticum TaxID=1325125 RepID=UPI0004925048|nr:type III-A CRISPR-associated RAMP protein Csm4 [Kallotenue papyrolyticum]